MATAPYHREHDHSAPCAELITTTRSVAMHDQALANSRDWQERIEERVDRVDTRINDMYRLVVTATFSAGLAAVTSLVVGIILLLGGKVLP